MAHILLVQEFGANLGHVNRLVSIARELGGHRFTFAVPDVALARPVIAHALGPDAEVVGRPTFDGVSPPRPTQQRDRTLADAFYFAGYAEPDALLRLAHRWRDLLARLAPDLIVGDFAPMLRLAVWNAIPAVAVSDGYCIPPLRSPLPPVLSGEALDPGSVTREAALLEAARHVRAALGGPPVRLFAELFWAERTYPSTSSMIDPYHRQRSVPIVARFTVPDIAGGPAIAQRTGPHIFCYMWSEHQALDVVLAALNGIARPIQIHIRGIDPHTLARHCAPQIAVHTTDADFRTLLPQTRLFIHYGGSGASATALRAGTMQLVLPTNLEQESTAARLSDASAGAILALLLNRQSDPVMLRRIIEAQLDDPLRQAAAMAVGQVAERVLEPDPRPIIVAACHELLAGASP